jgi:ATP-dependent RNA helicase DDX49/DBP8
MSGFQLFGGSKSLKKEKEKSEEELLQISNSDHLPPTSRKRALPSDLSTSLPPSFAHLGCLMPELLRTTYALGLRRPTAVQAACIPALTQRNDNDRGQDCIVRAPTGTGKTASFALPVLQRFSEDPYGIMCLILTPARELAYQIAEQVSALGTPLGVKVVTVTGGTDQVKEAGRLQDKPHIIVATPGRLAHQLAYGSAISIDLSKLAFLVFDECDRLLDPSFAPDLDVILKAAEGSRESRQTLLFSATITPLVRHLDTLNRFSIQINNLFEFGLEKEEERLESKKKNLLDSKKKKSVLSVSGITKVSEKEAEEEEEEMEKLNDEEEEEEYDTRTVDMPIDLIQQYVFIPAAVKNAYLWQILLVLGPENLSIVPDSSTSAKKGKSRVKHKRTVEEETSGSAALGSRAAIREKEEQALVRARSIIVFTSSCRNAQIVCEMLIELGIPTTSLHSALPQQQRLSSIAKFKGERVRVLVATDVASRGLDLPSVDLIVNYDVPRVPSDYVHRAGRTARAGRGGRCITFVTQYEVKLLQTIERVILGGDKISSLNVESVCPESKVLPRLTKVATAVHMAKSKLVETGIERTIQERKRRRDEAREEK